MGKVSVWVGLLLLLLLLLLLILLLLLLLLFSFHRIDTLMVSRLLVNLACACLSDLMAFVNVCTSCSQKSKPKSKAQTEEFSTTANKEK